MKMSTFYYLNKSLKSKPILMILVHEIMKKVHFSDFESVHCTRKTLPLYLWNVNPMMYLIEVTWLPSKSARMHLK